MKYVCQHLTYGCPWILRSFNINIAVASTGKHYRDENNFNVLYLFDRREGNVLFSANANGLC